MKGNVIILSASTGHGHNQVAQTLCYELKAQGYGATIIEPFKEKNKYLDELVSDGYKILATRVPKMFGTMYKLSNRRLMNRSLSNYFKFVLRSKLLELINKHEADMVISTHPLFVKAVSLLKRNGQYAGKVLSVITDYLPHEFYVSDDVDAYIVASNYTKHALIHRGISEDKIHVHGIPIKREFANSVPDVIRSDLFTVLLMGGSMGVTGMKKAFKQLMLIDKPMKIYVVCGRNESMKHTLETYEKYHHDVEVLGFTDRVPELMDKSDVIVSKPGGLTVTESLAKNIPMIIPYCIPGQEQENAEVLVEAGAAIRVDGHKELANTIEDLMDKPVMLEVLRTNIRTISKDHSLDKAIELCMAVCGSFEDMAGMKNA